MITPMKKVLVAGRASEREAVLSLLRDQGVVHVEPVHPELVVAAPTLQKQIAQTARIVEALAKIKPSAGATAPESPPHRLAEQVNALMDERTRLQAELIELAKEMERVTPWGRIIREDLESLRLSGLSVDFYMCSEGLEESIEADVRQVIAKKGGMVYLLTVSRKPIPPSPGAVRIQQPGRDVFELEAEHNRILERLQRIEESLHAMASRRSNLVAFHNELEQRKRFQEVELSLLNEGPIFILKGWVPAAEVTNIESSFDKNTLNVGIQFMDPDDEELPPTKLENPWWCRPIECLYKVLGITPGYREADISPFFLPFLTIFTAMLFADAGYGLVALMVLVLAYKPLTAKGVPKDLFQLFIVLFSGVVTYGLLTNTYFGETLIRLTPFDSMSPSGEAFIKKLCFFLGACHITIAHLWKIRRNPIGLASLSEIGWVLFVWAMYALVNVLVLGEPQPAWMIPLFGVSLALVLVFTSPSWNPFTAISRGLGAIALSAAAFLSDIISYIRLWAVGLAGGILAASFNELARPLPLLFAVIILVVAHFMNIALCLVAVFAHGVRLNLLEFSNHVGMEWSGREYEPFRKN